MTQLFIFRMNISKRRFMAQLKITLIIDYESAVGHLLYMRCNKTY